MKVIGITGGIGSGKSSVSEILRTHGFFIYDSDSRAKFLMNHNDDLIEKIKNLLGKNVYNELGLDRKLVAQIVFSDEDLLRQLNELVHPKVFEDFEFFKLHHRKDDFIFKESALLFETQSYKDCDKVLLVTADENIRINRVMQRDIVSKQEVINRMNKQWKEEDKKKLSDFIIENNGNYSELNQKVKDFLYLLKNSEV